MRDVRESLRATTHAACFVVEQEWSVRIQDLQPHLLRHTPQIVHFSGHGDLSGEIILENECGMAQPVSIAALKRLFMILKDNVICVVLNSCYSWQQADAIAEVIPCVIGMSSAIGDKAAIAFSSSFYQALGFGRSLGKAFELGCSRIELDGLNQEDIPKLIAPEIDPHTVFLTSLKPGDYSNQQTNFQGNIASEYTGIPPNNDLAPASIHMSLGGAHQGWGGTDQLTVNLQNEGFHPVQLIKCCAQWKTASGNTMRELKPETQIRWTRLVPWQSGYDNFVLPKRLNPGCVAHVEFKLTPKDIQASGIDTSKYLAAPGSDWMASSIVYKVSAQIRTDSGHIMSGVIVYFFALDKDKTLRVLLT